MTTAARPSQAGGPGRPQAAHPVGAPPGRLVGRAVAVEPQPGHPARPAAAIEQHLQLGGRPVRRRVRGRVPGRRPVARDEPPRRAQRGRDRLAPRPGADRVRAGRRPRPRDPGRLPARLRPAGHVARGSLVRDLVQRLPRADDRHRLHPRLPHLRPARQRVPAVQPQRGPVPPPDQRPVPDAQPAERQRAHAVRRHLPVREPRPRPLGPASPRDVAGPRGPGSRRRSAPVRRRSRRRRAGCSSTTAS